MDENRVVSENLMKLLIKLTEDGTSKWVHLCYISEDLVESYKENRPDDFKDLNSTITRWVKEDFNEDIHVDTAEELEHVKALIKAFCKNTYPDVYLEQATDRQGWIRVWISKKMREDLRTNGE